ncbi:MAG: hypothetical protein HQL56_07320 [Magnetococcales bacterium]|nr:hypothetical protein [Magnetococcales bacterium]
MGFLERCHPGAKLAAFVLMTGQVVLWPLGSSLIWLLVAVGLAAWVLRVLGKGRWQVMRLLWRARWFFLMIFLLHGWMTPGHLWWVDWAWSPTREGLERGWQQGWQLVLLMLLAFALGRSTSAWELAGLLRLEGEGRLREVWNGFLRRLAIAMAMVPRLTARLLEVRESLTLRWGASRPDEGWMGRLQGWVRLLDGFLLSLTADVRFQEESLLSRGFSREIPHLGLWRKSREVSWRDGALVAVPASLWMVWLWL